MKDDSLGDLPPQYGQRYLKAGVNTSAAERFVDVIKPLAKSTCRPGSHDLDLSGFAACFDLKATGLRDPLLVATSDGVGTKIKIAVAANLHHGIGVDLVAMCVNDLVVVGAEPLFFLDYFACGRLDTVIAQQLIAGMTEACRQVGCALISGETAEMPDLYQSGEYDLAGFAVGAVERGQQLPTQLAAGDILLGLASDGLHANGFSLIRQIIAEQALDYAQAAPFAPQYTLAEALLVPTRLYCNSVLTASRARTIKAAAHITGGGILNKLARIIPQPWQAQINPDSWPWLEIFRWLSQVGHLAVEETLSVFNCGIGMVLVVAPEQLALATEILTAQGEKVYQIGVITDRAPTDPNAVVCQQR